MAPNNGRASAAALNRQSDKIGQAAPQEFVRLTESEIAGVLGVSSRKEGLNVGELLGHQPIGIEETLEFEQSMYQVYPQMLRVHHHFTHEAEDVVFRILLMAREFRFCEAGPGQCA